jgi:hypothetical protein
VTHAWPPRGHGRFDAPLDRGVVCQGRQVQPAPSQKRIEDDRTAVDLDEAKAAVARVALPFRLGDADQPHASGQLAGRFAQARWICDQLGDTGHAESGRALAELAHGEPAVGLSPKVEVGGIGVNLIVEPGASGRSPSSSARSLPTARRLYPAMS